MREAWRTHPASCKTVEWTPTEDIRRRSNAPLDDAAGRRTANEPGRLPRPLLIFCASGGGRAFRHGPATPLLHRVSPRLQDRYLPPYPVPTARRAVIPTARRILPGRRESA